MGRAFNGKTFPRLKEWNFVTEPVAGAGVTEGLKPKQISGGPFQIWLRQCPTALTEFEWYTGSDKAPISVAAEV